MSAVTLVEAKAHLRIDFNDDDALIERLVDAADAYLAKVGVATATPAPEPVKQAILLLVGHWHDNREAADSDPPRAIAFGVNALVQAYREQEI